MDRAVEFGEGLNECVRNILLRFGDKRIENLDLVVIIEVFKKIRKRA